MSNYYVTDKYNGDKKPVASNDPVFGIRTIGASKWVDQSNPDPIKAIQGEIWAGAGHIEITAPGTGRGGRGNSTYEEFDTEQRQAIRELVKVNKVNLSVHATPNVQMTGFDNRSGFQEELRERSIQEVKKAIDFARDASSGGSVVVHTGEFPRSFDIPLAFGGTGDERRLFRNYATEADDAQFYLVDKESGRLIKSVRANEEISRPRYKKDDNGNDVYLKDEKGNAVYDEVLQRYILQRHGYDPDKLDNWKKISEEDKKRALVKLVDTDSNGNVILDGLKFSDFVKKELEKNRSMQEIVKEFYEDQAYGSVQQALGQSRRYETDYRESLKQREKIAKDLSFYKALHAKLGDGDEWEKVKADFSARTGENKLSQEVIDPIKKLEEAMGDYQRNILYGQETAIGGRRQAQEALRQIDNVQDIESYALEKSKKSFAELGIYAMEQTMAAKNARPKDGVKDIFVSLENIYPEMGFGSHPEELMKLTDNARAEMVKRLMDEKRVDSKKEAEELAKKHIKITFDTGHMNMWRKHFIPDKDSNGKEESKEKTDENFKKWYLEEVKKMAKGGYIGNVHLADNFGYDDTHLAPGHGSAPIIDVLEILKENGYSEKMAVEGGFNQGKNGYHETWKMVGAHVDNKYAKGRDGTDAWLNPNSNFRYVRDGYLGIANRPNFIFKGYSPDSDDWKPWSGLGME